MKKMRVIHGQTDRIEHGIGAHASRATVMTASATRVAALKVRDKALEHRVRADAGAGRHARHRQRRGGGRRPRRRPVDDARPDRRGARPELEARGDREPGLSAEGWFYADHQVYPYGNHLAVVKVDPDTGGVKVLRYVIGYDIGRAINPTLVKGQIAGGFAQGLGGALMEEFTYNERGDPLAVTFADYLMPTVRETPDLEIILTEDYPTPLNPLGIKGAGESGVNAVGAAIASAIDDAIGIPGAITVAAGDAAAAEGDYRREEVRATSMTGSIARCDGLHWPLLMLADAGAAAAEPEAHVDVLEVVSSGFSRSGRAGQARQDPPAIFPRRPR